MCSSVARGVWSCIVGMKQFILLVTGKVRGSQIGVGVEVEVVQKICRGLASWIYVLLVNILSHFIGEDKEY